jgi:putative ABC transport system permease protein
MKNPLINSILRNSLFRSKHSTVINLIGLSIGFVVLITITFFIREELNYNQFHRHINNIFCVFTRDHNSTNTLGDNESVPALAPALREEYPEVLDAALVYNGDGTMLVSYKEKKHYERIQLAEGNLFHIFSFPVSEGNIPVNTGETKIIALSRKMALKYFNSENPIGKQIKLNNKDLFTVVAIFENIPNNSSIRFDFWVPIKLLEEIKRKDYLKTWYNCSFSTYVLLKNHVLVTEINKKLLGRIQQSKASSTEKAQLYPFRNLYLDAWGHKKGIQMMIFIAIIIIALISINFINLQTAEAFKRIKEFGIKKLNGARNSLVYKELIAEAFVYVSVALFIAIVISYFGSSYLINLLGKETSAYPLISISSLLILIIIAFLIVFLSGIIPGITIQSVSASHSLKEKISEKVGIKKIRHILISLQFCMAIILIICLLVTNKQLNYLQNKNLGFEKEQLLCINLEGELKEKYKLLKKELDQNPSILSTSAASRSPIGIYWNGTGWSWEGKSPDFDPQITYIETDEDFQKTFGMNMEEGNYFKSGRSGVVINKTFAQMISHHGSALNKFLVNSEKNVNTQVMGVINDFNFEPLNECIGPLMLIPPQRLDEMKFLFVRISPDKMSSTLHFIKKTVLGINPDFPYEYHFLDEDFSRLYQREKRLRDQMMFFSIVAILISCMGLWGILIFMVKQRTKEIGIRKVNGARIIEVLTMLNKDFVKWVAIAFVIACPIGWYVMNQWLQSFAYKTELSWLVFASAGMIALIIAMFTVSWQSWRAARKNPVEALRYE